MAPGKLSSATEYKLGSAAAAGAGTAVAPSTAPPAAAAAVINRLLVTGFSVDVKES
ncbi:hypothetical protein GCM10009765_56540 [Fodinicola feengrottensis]|uniref:Uncharacterized protein n=1 Tax=Fodinicola feengrottensis TaxID=435914 RepID=A0ABP4U6V3_9ACTN